MKQPSWTVYTISDPVSGKPFYVGQTTALANRKYNHRHGMTPSTAKAIGAIQDTGREPVFEEVFTSHSRQEALTAEAELIAQLTKEGEQLCNVRLHLDRIRRARPTSQQALDRMQSMYDRLHN